MRTDEEQQKAHDKHIARQSERNRIAGLQKPSARELEAIVAKWLLWRGNKSVITRFYPQGWWECDVYAVTKSNYGVEVEVKVSRSDFFADKKKRFKHRILSGNGVAPASASIPRRFYYAVPEEMVVTKETPDYAGLMYVTKQRVEIVKKAPIIKQAQKLSEKQLDVLVRAHAFHYYALLDKIAVLERKQND